MSAKEKKIISVSSRDSNASFYARLVEEFIKNKEDDCDEREQEILLDKLEIYFQGKELIWEDLKCFLKVV